MDLLTRLERAVEHLFEGLFTHTFRGRVQPVEVARRLTRAMEDHKMVSVSQVFAPNEFEVALNPEDYKTIAPFEAAIVPELARHVQDTAAEARFELLGRPEVYFAEDENVERGGMQIDARFVRKDEQGKRAPDSPTSDLRLPARPGGPSLNRQAILQVIEGPDSGEEFPVLQTATSIGRGGSNDVPLSDSSVSRSHATIELEPDGFHFKDLGSKNGSYVNGLPASDHLLSDDDTITVGATVFRFRAARVL